MVWKSSKHVCSLMWTCFYVCVFVSIGLLISALCDTEIAAVQLAMGLFYPTLLLSGRSFLNG